MASTSKMRFFTSVPLPDTKDTHKTFEGMEDLLQKEHNSDGTHPIATESQSGFISAQDLKRLRTMYDYLRGLKAI